MKVWITRAQLSFSLSSSLPRYSSVRMCISLSRSRQKTKRWREEEQMRKGGKRKKEEEDLKFYRAAVGRSISWATICRDVGSWNLTYPSNADYLCARANIGWRRDACKYNRVYASACRRVCDTNTNYEANTNTKNANGRRRTQSDLSGGIRGENEVAVWRWLFAIRPRTLPSSPKPCPKRRTTSPH